MARGSYMGLVDDELGPTKSELMALLTIHTIKEIAEKYQVPADAVRGWCAIFRLPPKKTRGTANQRRKREQA